MQPAPLQTSAPVEWVSKEEAAKLLDKSERTILQMAADGRIKSKRERDPDNGQKVTLLHAGDVARLAHAPAESLQVARRPAADLQTADISAQIHIPAVHIPANQIPQTLAPLPLRPWLTLNEAAEYSGLTRRWLLAAAEGKNEFERGLVTCRDMGKGTRGGRWRFLRADLERA